MLCPATARSYHPSYAGHKKIGETPDSTRLHDAFFPKKVSRIGNQGSRVPQLVFNL
ncbi:hypothetical protein N665_0181s0095 [Sinapis alba]|nr:hypothetical protein N665_0181s0095 [Sinapis alba]